MLKRFLAVFALCAAALAQAPGFTPFSADLKTSEHKNAEAVTGKIYSGSGKMRMEMNSQGHDVVMITDPKTQTSLMIMPQQRMYMELHGNGGPMGPHAIL